MKNRVYIEVPKDWRNQARELHGDSLIVIVKRVLDEAPHIGMETQPVQTTPTSEAERAESEKTVKSSASTVYDHLSRYEGTGVEGKSDT